MGKRMGWLEWMVIIVLVVAVVIAFLVLRGPQATFGPDNLTSPL